MLRSPLLAVKKAGWDLEGGLASHPEGLGDYDIPCTSVLSVAGFLAILDPFLPGRTVYSEVKKAPFFPEYPNPG